MIFDLICSVFYVRFQICKVFLRNTVTFRLPNPTKFLSG